MSHSIQQWQARLESLNLEKIELGLDRIEAVYRRLSLTHPSRVVLIGGTNGKGSTLAALEALLLADGAEVGAYSSPHLQSFNERVRCQGAAVTDPELVAAFRRVEQVRADVPLTYFEFTTLAACAVLDTRSVDFLLAEVGLGGRLDAVNILDPEISVVTGVALDHTDWLGSDLESIGFEKAGIYRAGRPAIFASEDVPVSVTKHITEIGAQPFIRNREIFCTLSGSTLDIELRFPGDLMEFVSLRCPNLPQESVLAAVTAYRLLGYQMDRHSAEVLADVALPGRYQHLQVGQTHCILDVAHNAQSAHYLATRLRQDGVGSISAIAGVMADKPLAEIFAPLQIQVDTWYLVQTSTPRAASVETQRRCLLELGVDAEQIIAVGAVERVADYFSEMATAVVFGSFYTVGAFLDCFGGTR